MNHSSDKSPQPSPNLAELLKVLPKRIDVALLPSMIDPEQLRNRTVVVTDVLRATTTVIQALVNGCVQVLPQPSIDGAKQCHQQTPNSVLGGERGGRIIPGFHQGNSPLEYDRTRIGGKTLILATTNGTVAMERCRLARQVLIGAMINLGAVADRIGIDDKITIVCSGTDGEITSEDTLFAGALVERILQKQIAVRSGLKASGNSAACSTELDAIRDPSSASPPQVAPRPDPLEHLDQISDMALIALNHWQQTCVQIEQGMTLANLFKVARGGVNLVKIGLDADIEFAARLDAVSAVPELNLADWAIRLV